MLGKEVACCESPVDNEAEKRTEKTFIDVSDRAFICDEKHKSDNVTYNLFGRGVFYNDKLNYVESNCAFKFQNGYSEYVSISDFYGSDSETITKELNKLTTFNGMLLKYINHLRKMRLAIANAENTKIKVPSGIKSVEAKPKTK